MEGKLFKMVEGYTLSLTGSIDDLYGISNEQLAADHGLHKLSLEHCEAIANGYDLDELTNRAFDNMGYHSTVTPYEEKQFKLGYRVAFRESIELLGDKKFSELDKKIDGMVDFAKNHFTTDAYDIIQMFVDNLKVNIQKIQQPKEWDVEIVMESKDIDELRVDKGSFLKPNDIYKPKLDENKCLILKRK